MCIKKIMQMPHYGPPFWKEFLSIGKHAVITKLRQSSLAPQPYEIKKKQFINDGYVQNEKFRSLNTS